MKPNDPSKTQLVDPLALVLQAVESVNASLEGIRSDIAGLKSAGAKTVDEVSRLSGTVKAQGDQLARQAQEVAKARDLARESIQSASDIKITTEEFHSAVMVHIGNAQRSTDERIEILGVDIERLDGKVSAQGFSLASLESTLKNSDRSLTKLTKWSQHPLLRVVGTIIGAAVASYFATRANLVEHAEHLAPPALTAPSH